MEGAKAITAFAFEKDKNTALSAMIEGIIDEQEHTIRLTVPYDANITELVPSITLSPRAVLTPSADTPRNFTSPVSYTVKAWDGSTKSYSIVVSRTLPGEEKSITAFDLKAADNTALKYDAAGSVNETAHIITLKVPMGTDITNLKPEITVSPGAAVFPASGIAQDFTSSRTYTVTAQDGSKQIYNVTVSEIAVSLSTFKFLAGNNGALDSDIDGTINPSDHSITLTVPYGTDITALKPSISLPSGTIDPGANIAQDFSQGPVTYILNQYGVKQDYSVIVTVEGPGEEKSIKAFDFKAVDNTALKYDAAGSVNETAHIITLKVPMGTDITNLKPEITVSPETTVFPASGIAQDFTSSRTYTVTAQDGSKQTYNVTVSEIAVSLSTFKFLAGNNGALDSDIDGTINPSDHSITLTVPYGTDITALKPSISLPSGTIDPGANIAQDFSQGPVTYILNQYGVKQDYSVIVTVEGPGEEKSIKAFDFKAVDNTALKYDAAGSVNETAHIITLKVPMGTDITNLKPEITVSPGAVVSPASGTAQNFTSSRTYTVTAQDGSKQTYNVTVSEIAVSINSFTFLAGNNDALDHDITGSIMPQSHSITLTVPCGTDITALKPGIGLPSGTIDPGANIAQDFSQGPVTYTLNQYGVKQDYSVTVNKSAPIHLLSFKIPSANNTSHGIWADVEGVIDETASTISLKFPHGTDLANLETEISLPSGTNINPASGTRQDFTNPVRYYVTNNAGNSHYYTVMSTVAETIPINSFSFLVSDNPDSLIENVTGVIDTDASTISLIMPYSTHTTFTPSITIPAGATIYPASGTDMDINNPLDYDITQDGVSQRYTVTVTKTAAATEDIIAGPHNIKDNFMLELSPSRRRFFMIYANDSENRNFPAGIADNETKTLTRKFWIGETEIRNEDVAAILQWALGKGKFSTTETDPNGLSANTVKHGEQELVDLDHSDCRISYNVSEQTFEMEDGYKNHPATFISWYGAVMICNWLTEMRDGNTDNVVYTGISPGGWNHGETIENFDKNGYRLPTEWEWEYAARYQDDAVNTVSGYSDPYYTKGECASGASVNGQMETKAVAWYADNSGNDTHSVGGKDPNSLGLYDMSGNVEEMCSGHYNSNPYGGSRITRGGDYDSPFFIPGSVSNLKIGECHDYDVPEEGYATMGFRLCRTAD